MMNRCLINFAIFFFSISLFVLRPAMADYPDGYYEIDTIINGDSFELTDGQRVRLIGIEAPKAGETCSVQSTERLSSLIDGETVYLEKDVSETDSNGELLRYAYVNGIFVNYRLVYDGYAYADISYPDTKYSSELTDAEENARHEKRGCLWYERCTNCDDDSTHVVVSCFIATAAYGSPIDPHVKILRKFRDNYLMTNYWGRKFVCFYYAHSPVIATHISSHESLKAMTRIGLLPFIGFSWMVLKLGFIFASALVLMFVAGLIGLKRSKKK